MQCCIKKYTYKCKFDVRELSYKGEKSFFAITQNSNKQVEYTYNFLACIFFTRQMPEIEKGISIVLYHIKRNKL